MTVDSETMTRVPSALLDQARVEEFAGRLVGVLNDGALALLCHLGHQLGLFDTMATIGSTTSGELAEATGLSERYVREWLGGTVVGGIVDHDPVDDTYHLPPEHAASLTRAAGPDNLARVLGFLPVLAQVEQPVTAAFRNGGGVPYTAYETFHSVMADMSDAVFDAALLDVVLPLVDDLPARLTVGAEVADFGCGRGHAVNLMARAYPQSRFVGYDFSEEAIEAARAEAQRLGLTNARFDVQDVSALAAVEEFDVITAFDAIHDQAQPARVLERIHQALKPGGTFLMVDIKASSHLQDNHDLPFGPFLYTVSLMHCMTVSLALDGEGLGTVWGRQRALGMLDEAGFTEVEVRDLEADPLNLYYIATKP